MARKPMPCSIEGCDRDAVTRGWCHGHYQRWVRLGDVRPSRPLGRQVNFACSVDGCQRDAYARQLCRIHYRRWLSNGDPQPDKPVRTVNGTGYVHRTGYFVVPVPPELRHLWTRWQPSGHRVQDRIADASGVLLRYAPYLLAAPGRRRRFRCDGQLTIEFQKTGVS